MQDRKGIVGAVVGLHGRMQTAESLRDKLGPAIPASFSLTCPQAPSGQWWPKRFSAPVRDNQPWLAESLALVERTIVDLEEGGLDRGDIVIVGFSQGAALACEFTFQAKRPPGRLMVMTGSLLGESPAAWDSARSLKGVTAYFSGGKYDEHVPWSFVAATASHFKALGATTQLRLFDDAEHSIRREELELMGAMLEAGPQESRHMG